MRVAVVLLAGCGAAYQPGSFVSHEGAFDGERTTVGCLDVAVSRRFDLTGAAVLAYELGNRCDHPALVDLANVRVHAQSDGLERALTPYDPRGELVPLRLPGRQIGREAIAYVSATSATRVCVDAASIAHATPERWLCFAPVAL